MAQQSSGEFASTDPTTRTQDAKVQERSPSSYNLDAIIAAVKAANNNHPSD
jgi:hypothetical protein